MTEPEMSRQAREMLQRYRSAESLGSAARARMLTGLRAKIATGAPTLGASKSLLSKVAAAGKAKLILGALAVAVPAAWTIHRSQSSVDYTLRTATPEVPAAPAVTAKPEVTPQLRALDGEPYGSAAPAPESAPAAAAAESDDHKADTARTATAKQPLASPRTSPTPAPAAAPKVTLEESKDEAPAVRTAEAPAESTLDQEMQLLKRAHVAQSAGRPTEALAILAEHAKRFPNGKLAESREVSRIIALCESGQTQAGRSAADRFLAARPNSPFASRVRAACAK